jgi:glycosyltransferase involved in cell wall biosynthesis
MARIAVTGLRGVPASWGGVEHHCEELYSRLAAHGHDITIYARTSYVTDDIRFYKGMKIIRLPTINAVGLEAFVHTVLSVMHIVKTRPDIVQFCCQGPCLLSWVPRLFRPGMRVFFTCFGLDWQRKKWSKFASSVIHLGEVFSSIFPHYGITVSKELQRYYRTRYGVKVHYIPSGVRKMEKRRANFIRSFGLLGKDYFLFVGRLVPEKRIDDVIRAFLRKKRQSKLVIVGESSGTDTYVAQLRRMANGHSSIIFAGYQYGDNLEEFYSNARAFVSASELEGLPLTMLEALSYGLPCIASDIPPHKEILEYQLDLLFPTGEIDSLSDLLDRFDEASEAVLADSGSRAMAILDRDFNWDHIAGATEELFEESLKGIRPPAGANPRQR